MKTRILQATCIILVIASIVVVAVFHRPRQASGTKYEDGIEYIDPNTIVLSDSGARVTFSEVILSPPEETRKLVVFQQDATVSADIEKSKIKNWNIDALMQNQKVTYTGKGSFVVDLDKLTEDCIIDDKDSKTLTLKIEHPKLDTIEIDPNNIKIGTQNNGFLGFGDLALTVTDYVNLEKDLRKRLTDKLDTSANGQQADDIALKMVKKIYEPVVQAVDDDYTLVVEFK